MDRDFSFQGKSFKLCKVNALKQFHLVRRIVPILNDLGPQIGEIQSAMKNQAEMSDDKKFEQIFKFVMPIMNGLSRLSDKDSEYVLIGLLEAVEMKQEEHGNWARLGRDGRLMFDNLELPIMLNAAGRAFAFNLAGFFDILPQVS